MKKFAIILTLIISACFVFASCGENTNSNDKNTVSSSDSTSSSSKKVDIKEELMGVVKNEKTFINGDGNSIFLKDFQVPNLATNIEIKPQKYAFVDIDNDKTNELIISCNEDLGFDIILHYDSNESSIYGYYYNIRSFISPKKDGTFKTSSGFNILTISRLKFDKTESEIVNIAVFDEPSGTYKIDDKDVTKDEAQKYFDDWAKSSDVDWINI